MILGQQIAHLLSLHIMEKELMELALKLVTWNGEAEKETFFIIQETI